MIAKVGSWRVVPLGGYLGGQIRWRPQNWGAEVEITQYQRSVDGISPPPDKTVSVRIPWKVLAQMLVTRDERTP
jgi:hypothetical protein